MEWIKITDRLPDVGTAILGCINGDDEACILYVSINSKGLNFTGQLGHTRDFFGYGVEGWEYSLEQLTHWMPLPSIPIKH